MSNPGSSRPTACTDDAGVTADPSLGQDTIDWGPPWIGPVHHRVQIDLLWLLIGAVMLAAGLVFFGWRVLLGVGMTSLATLSTYVLISIVLKLLWPRIMIDSNLHALALGLLVGLALPAGSDTMILWIAGLLMGVVAHVVGRSHRLRIHPVVVVLLLTWPLGTIWELNEARQNPHTPLSPRAVLRPERVVVGDLCDVTENLDRQPWLTVSPIGLSRRVSAYRARGVAQDISGRYFTRPIGVYPDAGHWPIGAYGRSSIGRRAGGDGR